MRFGEKVYNKKEIIFTIVLVSFITLALGVTLLVLALNNDALDCVEWLELIFSGFSFFVFLCYSVLCPILIKIYPKYKRLLFVFIRKECFIPMDDENK